MDIGLVGAGRMGAGMLRRWTTAGHTVQVYDPDPEKKVLIEECGGTSVGSLQELVSALTNPRVCWLMVPAGEAVRETVMDLGKLLDQNDTIIDGGNSNFKDSQAHDVKLRKRDVHFIDAGVSGGLAGEEAGYALMVGGEAKHVMAVQEVFDALKAEDAFAHVGPAGAGHFVKMVHNAVEYGMMQAIGEGFDLLKNGPYKELDLRPVAELWSHGTIVRSYLMELTAQALQKDGDLAGIAGYVDDSGEGRWSVETAVESAVPFWVNTAALYARFDSRQNDSFAAKIVAALRKEFGGHDVKRSDQ